LKYFLLLIIVFLSALVYGQGWNETGYNKEVYLEYENKIWFPKNHGAQHDYKCSNCQIKYFDRGILLTVETKAPNIVIYQINKKTNRVVDSLQLTVREYPKPTVCWNERTSDGKRGIPVCTNNFNSISVHLNCRFDDTFEIDSTNISIGNKSYVSIGKNTSEEVSKAIWAERDSLVKVNICVYARNQRGKKIKVCEDFEIVNPFFIGHYRVENIKTIHRNKSTEFLFDENNSFSFVGYAQRTVLKTFFSMSYRAAYGFFMRFEKLEYLTKIQWKAFVPILDSYGCESIDYSGHYLYPPNPELLIDKTNINCILLVEENPINFPLHHAPRPRTRVIFAKKYDDDNSGKMEFVFSFLLEELESSQQGLYLKELPINIVEKFWSENENTGILPIMRRCKAQNDSIKTTYSSSWRVNDCKYLYYFPNQDWFNLVKPKDYSTGHYSDYVHSVFSPEIWRIAPFKNFSKTFSEFMTVNDINLFDEFAVFTKGSLTIYKTEPYNTTKPILDEHGNKILLYQQAAFYYAYNKDIRAYQIFELNQNKDSLITAKVLITLNHEGHEIPFLLVRLRDLTQFDYLRQHNAIPISKLPWKLELENALSYSKVYDPNNAEDLKELDALFYLDAYDGKPLNMLNVCLGCD
jgi:hypothetical protein